MTVLAYVLWIHDFIEGLVYIYVVDLRFCKRLKEFKLEYGKHETCIHDL